MKNLVSVSQLDKNSLAKIMSLAKKMEDAVKRGRVKESLKSKVVACLFFEPSTRTRLSFETAALKLGAKVVSMENGSESSSAFKGESITDTMEMVNCYADLIIMRHPKDGIAEIAAGAAKPGFINAGDGGNQHPSQALLDFYTIWKRFGRFSNLEVAFGFDPKHSRTIKSLCKLLSLYPGNTFHFVCPKQLDPSPEFLKFLKSRKTKFSVVRDLSQVLGSDILYLNRLQNERFKSQAEFEKLRHKFCLTAKMLKGKKALVMNPLPRIDEMEPAVDKTPNAIYFEQAQNGLYVRMALVEMFCS